MRRIALGFALLLLFGPVFSQDYKGRNSRNSHWRSLSIKFGRQRNATAIVADLQQLISAAKAANKFGVAIHYELLLGEQHEKSNDFGLAEAVLVQAYEEARQHMPARHQNYYVYKKQFQTTFFDPIDRLGYFYLTIGNLRHAEQLFQESMALRNHYFPVHSIHRVHPVVGLGSYYFRKGDIGKTYAQFNLAQKMMARATTTGYDFDLLNRLFLGDLVELCLMMNKDREALNYINQLSIASSGFGKFSSTVSARLEVARVFELKSRYYLMRGEFQRAQEYLDKANHYNPPNLSASVLKLRLFKTEALIRWYQGEAESAAESFQRMIGAYHEHINSNFASMSDYEREQFYKTLKADFDLFNAFVVENADLKTFSLYEEMYDNILRTKALLFSETNRLKTQILQSGNQKLIDQLNEWEASKNDLAALYFEKNSSQQIASLEKKIEDLEHDINQYSGLFFKRDASISWKGVQAHLKEGEAAMEIVRINRFDRQHPGRLGIRNGLTDSIQYLALVVTPQSAHPEGYLLQGNQLENRYLPFYRNSIIAKSDDSESYEHFWRPIRQHLTGIKRVFLSADGVYNQINLNTLRNPASGQYLIDEIELVRVTNSGDLLKPEIKNEDHLSVLIGRPAFEFSAKEMGKGLSPAVPGVRGMRRLAAEELTSLRDQDFSDLPGTAEEVSLIAAELSSQGTKVISYTGENALEENVKALVNPEVLHIATHGFFVEDSASSISPMIRSGIILAGVRNQKNGNREDGILTAYEASNLRLEGTNLVVLSACDTGLGEVRNGEGVYGLQRSVIVAGARNLLMSLWKVDDEATASLMTSFYHLRLKMGNLEAFREAQIQLRRKYPEPYYWGAFVMLGK